MTRDAFHARIDEIRRDVALLAAKFEQALTKAMSALRERNRDLAITVIAEDDAINRLRFAIQEKALETIATQQPVAVDLRMLAAALHIIVELERMGDHAEGIAKNAVGLMRELPIEIPGAFRSMERACLEMTQDAIQAYLNLDVDRARAVCVEDEEVDRLHDRTQLDLIEKMTREPQLIQPAIYLTWVSHNLERIADRATNIAEWVIYAQSGAIVELNVSRS